MARRKISILVFSPIARDARVLRQARYLAAEYEVTVIAYAPEDCVSERLAEGVRLLPVTPPERTGLTRRLRTLALLLAGRAGLTRVYERLYWSYPVYRGAAQLLRESRPEIIVANDWNALPAAVSVAKTSGAPVVIDLHEYAPRQWDNRPVVRFLRGPMADYVLAEYLPQVAATLTVSESLAAVYSERYRVAPTVLLNAPEPSTLPPLRACSPQRIRVIHHGAAARGRQLERIVRAVAGADARYELEMMLVDTDPAYRRELEELADRSAPGRVRFLSPVPPHRVVSTLASYDLGLYLLPPTTLNHVLALPNKLFDFINAGLAVVVGPTPEMARVVRQWGCGAVVDTDEPGDVAALLSDLTAEDIDRFKRRSREAARVLNADVEHKKLLRLIADLEGARPT